MLAAVILAVAAAAMAGYAWFMAWQSGWLTLAERWAAPQPAEGARLDWISASLDGVSFRSALHAVAAPAGLSLRPVSLLRPFMKPVLIPWSEIRFLQASAPMGLRRVRFRLGATEGPELDAGPALAAAIGPRLPEPQKSAYEDALSALTPTPLRKLAAVSLGIGAAASALFYALAGGPHGVPWPIVLLPLILIPALMLTRER